MTKTVYRPSGDDAATLLTELTGLQHRFLQAGVNPEHVIRTIRELRLRPQPFKTGAYYEGRWDDLWPTDVGFLVRVGDVFTMHTDTEVYPLSTSGMGWWRKHRRGLLLLSGGWACLETGRARIRLDQGIRWRALEPHPYGALAYEEFETERGHSRDRIHLVTWPPEPETMRQDQLSAVVVIDDLSPLHRIYPCAAGLVWDRHDGGWEHNHDFVLCTVTGSFPLFTGTTFNYLVHPDGVIVQTIHEKSSRITLHTGHESRLLCADVDCRGIQQSNGADPVWGLAHPRGVVLQCDERLVLYTGDEEIVLYPRGPYEDACINELGVVSFRTSRNQIVQCEVGCAPRLVSDIPHRIVFGPHRHGALLVESGRAFICSPRED